MTTTTFDAALESPPRRDLADTSRDRPPPADNRSGAHRAGVSDRWIAVTLATIAMLVRVPFQSEYLVNFDSVNFALGMDGFDLERHEPHPPGYLGYVVLARAMRFIAGDANRALTLLSVLAAGVTTAVVFLLARRMASRGAASTVAVLFGLSPLAWYYGVVGLSYLPAAAITLGLVLACHGARFHGSERQAMVAALLLAALGALRQTDIVLYAPLVAFATWRLPARVRVRAACLVAVTSTAWFVPLLVLSGGPVAYVELSRDLAVLAGGRTSVFGLDPAGLVRNVRLVGAALALGIFAAAVPMAITVRRRLLDRDERRFLLIWTVPSLLVFLLVHTGQLGYALPIVPAVYLVMARGIDERWRAGPRWTRWGRPRWRPHVAALAVGAMATINLLAVAIVPGRALAAARNGGVEVPVVGTLPLPDESEIRPIDLAASDAHWRSLLEYAARADPDTSVILARTNTAVSFRHLSYYLREHLVFAIGPGAEDDFGALFTAFEGRTDYSVQGLGQPAHELELPPSVTEVVVFDMQPRDLHVVLPHAWERLDHGGSDAVSIEVPAGATLQFRVGAGGGVTIDTAPSS